MKEDGREMHFQFCCKLQQMTEQHENFFNQLIFSDEAHLIPMGRRIDMIVEHEAKENRSGN